MERSSIVVVARDSEGKDVITSKATCIKPSLEEEDIGAIHMSHMLESEMKWSQVVIESAIVGSLS